MANTAAARTDSIINNSSDRLRSLTLIPADPAAHTEVLLVEADVIDHTDDTSTDRHDPIKLPMTSPRHTKYWGRRRLLRARPNLNLNRRGKGRVDLNRNGDIEPLPVGQKAGGR